MRLVRINLISQAWACLPNERRRIVGLGGLSVVSAQAESTALILIALFVDSLATGTSEVSLDAGPLSVELGFGVAGVVAVSGVLVAALTESWLGYRTAKAYARLEMEAREGIVRSYAAASWEFQSTQRASRIHSRLLRLMNAKSNTFGGLVGWIRSAATIVTFFVAALALSAIGALTIIAFGFILNLGVLPIRRKIKSFSTDTVEGEVAVSADFAEAVDQGADVQTFGAWPAFVARFDNRSTYLANLTTRLRIAKSLLPVVYQSGALLLILAILLIATSSTAETDIGPFAASALLLLRSVQYGQQLQLRLQSLAEAVPRVELLESELRTPASRMEIGQEQLQEVREVRLDQVAYSYPEAPSRAVSEVSLRLLPGTIYGLAGPSGSGKSTLAQVLLRLRWPTEGLFVINGVEANEFSEDSWRSVVSHVPQHPRLLHGSLYENVVFLDESISREKVIETLDLVGLRQTVSELPDGLDTVVGPSGRSLSGGQVQRLGIARALVRDPDLLVLDEPTSALDVDSEQIFTEAVDTLRCKKKATVVVIAHRASTLSVCDEIIVLKDGKVVTVGTPYEVSTQSDFFARILSGRE